jgi:SPP1 gp7 family putative phage head morphogenesis protein
VRSSRWERFFRAQARRVRAAERHYGVLMRVIAKQIDIIVNGLYADEATRWEHIEGALDDYAALLTPWARQVGQNMLTNVSARDYATWVRLGREIGRSLGLEVASVAMAPTLASLLADQVLSIRSLPLDAKERVHTLSIEALTGGKRWEQIREEIEDQGQVSRGQANTIARTETARAASTIQSTRAQGIGSDGFVWRTARDADVRRLHRELEGKFFHWDDPPILDDGRPGLPGTIYNCRCWAEPVLAGELPQLGPLARNPAYLAALQAAGYTTGTAFE